MGPSRATAAGSWSISRRADDAAKTRRFRLEPLPAASALPPPSRFRTTVLPRSELPSRRNRCFVYNYGVITDEKVPASDTRRSRACYIHPLWGLNGEVLTDDFPKDHYHHHGVFWAWPHVEIRRREADLWEYQKITPKFVRWLTRETGPLAAVLGVENGWFVGDRKVMIERVWIQVAKATPTERAIDLDFTLIPVDRPITLRGAEGKSYGGLNVRFDVAEREGLDDHRAGRHRGEGPAGHAAALGRPDRQVRRGKATQRGRDLYSSRPSELSAHLADAALWRDVRRLAGRERKEIRARQADPLAVSHLDPLRHRRCRRR